MDGQPPAGYVAREDRGVRAMLRSGYEGVFETLVPLLDGAGPKPGPTTLEGRGAVAAVAVPGRAETMIVRRYRHGGAFRFLGGRMLLSSGRPFAELRALEAAARGGVHVARAVAALSAGSIVSARGLLATIAEEGVVDLLAWLLPRPGRSRRRAVARALAAEVRRLHDAGIVHADLHVKNVLVREDGGGRASVVLIDFDRARVLGAPLKDSLRFRNLFRLDRSVEKTGLSSRGLVSRADRLAVLRAYLSAPRLRSVESLRPRLFRARLGLALHRLAWRISGASA